MLPNSLLTWGLGMGTRLWTGGQDYSRGSIRRKLEKQIDSLRGIPDGTIGPVENKLLQYGDLQGLVVKGKKIYTAWYRL